jgi:hypothetical protein
MRIYFSTLYILTIALATIFLTACSTSTEPSEVSEAEVENNETPQPENKATNTPDNTPTPTLTPTAEGPVTVQVNADGSGDYETLETAIAAVFAGSTIELSEGTFELQEMLVLDQSLTIVGADKDQTRIVSEAETAVILYSGEGPLTIHDLSLHHQGVMAAEVLILQSAEANLSNCIISGGINSEDQLGAGLLLENTSQANVSNCQFIDNAGVGVLVRGDSQLDMEASIVTHNGFGVAFTNNSSGQIVNNVIEKNNESGVLVLGYAIPLISSNHIINNLQNGIHYALDGAGGGLAEGNELRRNNTEESIDNGTDIAIVGSYAPDLKDNICSGGEGLNFSFGNTVIADQSGILFIAMGVASPQVGSFTFKDNDCAYAYCGYEPGGSTFDDFECFDLDESKISE